MRYILLLALCAAAIAEEPTERRYVLTVRGATAGYAWYRESVAADGTRTIEGETLLELLQNGETNAVRSKRTTVIGKGEAVPRSYKATSARDGKESSYDCSVERGNIVVRATIRGTETNASWPLATVPALLDHNAPEHFEVFLAERRKTAGKFQCVVGVVEMMAPLPIAGSVGAEEEVAVDGSVVRATKVEFSAIGLAYRAWLDEDGRVVKLAVPSQAFEAVRTEKRLEDLDLSPADLMRSFSVPLRVAQGVDGPTERAREPGGVVEARFRVHVKVGENRTDPEALTNWRQEFEGAKDAQPGWVDGVITVTPRRVPGDEDPSPFVAPEDGIESDAAEIKARAAEVIPEGTSVPEAARRAAAWVHGAMRYETQLVSALAAHQGRVGDCLSYARLTIALLRARGVPARTIGGIALGGSKRLGQHHWVEVRAPDGWIQVDPTYGQTTGVDAFHLDLWRQGTLDGSADNWVELEAWTPALK